ncbi:hypothetical protein [Microcoleus sp. B9-D4]|uniref:hypothetical protein n=1 Tax=Microcoleus sp. B9-D4 TaxID=2818711 RepID=UPI002FD7296E
MSEDFRYETGVSTPGGLDNEPTSPWRGLTNGLTNQIRSPPSIQKNPIAHPQKPIAPFPKSRSKYYL